MCRNGVACVHCTNWLLCYPRLERKMNCDKQQHQQWWNFTKRRNVNVHNTNSLLVIVETRIDTDACLFFGCTFLIANWFVCHFPNINTSDRNLFRRIENSGVFNSQILFTFFLYFAAKWFERKKKTNSSCGKLHMRASVLISIAFLKKKIIYIEYRWVRDSACVL